MRGGGVGIPAFRRDGRFAFAGTTSAPRGLPGAATAVAGNDPAPATGAIIAGEPAAAAGVRGANGYADGDAATAADKARDPAAAGRQDTAARYREGNAVA